MTKIEGGVPPVHPMKNSQNNPNRRKLPEERVVEVRDTAQVNATTEERLVVLKREVEALKSAQRAAESMHYESHVDEQDVRSAMASDKVKIQALEKQIEILEGE